MMEFTYEGVVRQGFGFYNPNHAAALICAVMPFLWTLGLHWKQRTLRAGAVILSIILLAGLAMTFSRTGVLVLFLELILFFILNRIRNWKWKWMLAAVFSIAVIFTLCGVLARFTPDRAVTNRLEIWKAGAALFAANPWFGSGLGNSGTLATAFLLPDGIVCRTLVNSHLTLLAEFGFFAGFLWIVSIVYALLNGVRKKAAWIAFAGLTVSASFASVLDWDVLFDFQGFGTLPISNFLLSWTLLLLYIGLGVRLCFGKPKWKQAAVAAGAALACCLVSFLFTSERAPRIDGEFVVKPGRETPLILYDDTWTLKTVLPFLKDGYRLPVRSWQNRKNTPPGVFREVWLFGECAHFASLFPDAELIFVSPPEHFNFPSNTAKVCLKRFTAPRAEIRNLEYY